MDNFKDKFYFHSLHFLLAIDQLFNVLTGGWSDETFSSRCYRNRNCKIFSYIGKFINILFFWQKDHCKKAYFSELRKKHWPRKNN